MEVISFLVCAFEFSCLDIPACTHDAYLVHPGEWGERTLSGVHSQVKTTNHI